MIIQNKSRSLPILFIVIGEILILTALFLLVDRESRNEVFWLNVFIISILYLANINNFFDLFGFNKYFDDQIAGIGVQWFLMILYSIFTIGCIVLGWVLPIPFNIQLVVQLFLLLGLAVSFYISYSTNRHVVSVRLQDGQVNNGIDRIESMFLDLEYQILSKGEAWISQKQMMGTFREKARYLSSSRNPEALSIENQIIEGGERLSELLKGEAPDPGRVQLLMQGMEGLLNRRKEYYYHK